MKQKQTGQLLMMEAENTLPPEKCPSEVKYHKVTAIQSWSSSSIYRDQDQEFLLQWLITTR